MFKAKVNFAYIPFKAKVCPEKMFYAFAVFFDVEPTTSLRYPHVSVAGEREAMILIQICCVDGSAAPRRPVRIL